jgi:hypothetical protein
MAAAIYNKISNTQNADSVGAYVGAIDEPEGRVLSNLFPTTDFFEVMEENEMYVRDNVTKGLNPNMLDVYDTVVSMVEDPDIPEYLKSDKRVIWWNIKNPSFVDRQVAEDTYNKIYSLVEDLLK